MQNSTQKTFFLTAERLTKLKRPEQFSRKMLGLGYSIGGRCCDFYKEGVKIKMSDLSKGTLAITLEGVIENEAFVLSDTSGFALQELHKFYPISSIQDNFCRNRTYYS